MLHKSMVHMSELYVVVDVPLFVITIFVVFSVCNF